MPPATAPAAPVRRSAVGLAWSSPGPHTRPSPMPGAAHARPGAPALPPGPVAFVFSIGGTLLSSTPGATPWLAAARAAAEAPVAAPRPPSGPLSVAVPPLVGADGTCILVMITPCDAPAAEPLPALSPRCREVAEFLAAGATIDEVARHLGLRPSTVREYRDRLYKQLDVACRVELAERLRG